MVKKLSCSLGHHWRVADDQLSWSELRENACPICGAEAETVTDDSNIQETRENSPSFQTVVGAPDHLTGYDVYDEAGRGGMGVVYRAFDRQRHRIVALKTLHRIDPVALQRFKNEFRSLSDIAHPNLVALYELISDGEHWCFSMEFIEGVDLLKYIRHGPSGRSDVQPLVGDATIELDRSAIGQDRKLGLSPDQVARLRSVVGQLASGISALHSAGILHRDIKPSNVLVTPEGRTVLLDFGLAAELDNSQLHHNSDDRILGTVAYMSPEQAAGRTISRATDWYSVGSLLYEALTGIQPFRGKTLSILQAKQREDPPLPSTIWPDVPKDLEQLCARLLNRDPERRATGSEVLRALQQASLADESSEPAPIEADHLIGREHHLAALREAYEDVKAGRPASAFVRGESGNGKSTLVRHFLDEVRRHGETVVLSGRCYERESVPFKAIDSLVDSVVAHFKRLPQAEAEAVMPRDIESLTRLFPVVGQIKAAAVLPRRKPEISDQQELNRRAIRALRELLARMGDRRPLVVYIDDLQWGDEDSAAMVSDLLQPPDAPVLLFLGTYRSEDGDNSPFLNAYRHVQLQRETPIESLQVDVRPLEHADAAQLALALLERDDGDARQSAEAVAREAAGNPFFVSELVKHLQEGAFELGSSEPLSMTDMIWSRVERLPTDARRLLEVVALWGQPLPLGQAMEIVNAGPEAVGPLRAGHLIRTAGPLTSSIIETYHDRVRETIAARLDDTSRQQHHMDIAQHVASTSPLGADQLMKCLDAGGDELVVHDSWYVLAFHFSAADQLDMAFPFALATAESARSQFSLDVAEQQYRIAELGLGLAKYERFRSRVVEGLGDVLMLRGKYAASSEEFQSARKLVTDAHAARIEGKLGVLAFKQGDNQAGIEAMERALKLLGRRIPSRAAGFLLSLSWEVLVQTLHTAFPKLFLARRSLAGAELELLVIDMHVHLSRAYFFERGKIPCLWSHLHSINLAERFPPTRELGHAWAAHAPVLSLIPWVRRGEVFAKRSLEIRKELGDVCGQGQSLHYLGVMYFASARFDDCIAACRDAVRLLERTGDYWERNMALFSSANAVYRKGDLKLAIDETQRLYEICNEMGDDKVSGFALDIWSRASGGRLPAEIVQREVNKSRNDVWATSQVMLAEAVRLIGQGELDRGIEFLNQGYEVCRKGGMNSWVSSVLPWLATARRLQCQRESDPARRRQLLRSAHRAACKALPVARKFLTDLPHALRECGLVAAMRGKIDRSRKLLDESSSVAKKQGAWFEHSQTLLARGIIGQQHQWPDAQQEKVAAQKAISTIGADFAFELAPLEKDLL